MPRISRSPRSVYYRALRRVQRRATAYLAAKRAGHAFAVAVAYRLLAQACSLANVLALL